MTIFDFIKGIDPEIELEVADHFCADVDKKIVFVGTEDEPEAEELMHEFVKEEFGVEMDNVLISLLHEVGHIMTQNDEELRDRSILDVVLQLNWTDSDNDIDEDFEKYNNLYFRLPSEYQATEWAANYYREHKELCDEFVREME